LSAGNLFFFLISDIHFSADFAAPWTPPPGAAVANAHFPRATPLLKFQYTKQAKVPCFTALTEFAILLNSKHTDQALCQQKLSEYSPMKRLVCKLTPCSLVSATENNKQTNL
jgi:hypothetical protein